jgi:cytochrome P450 PksS
MMDTTTIFLPDPKLKPNPYPLYAQLRDEAPVAKVRGRYGLYWLVTRYDDVSSMLKDERLANDSRRIPGRKTPVQFKILSTLFRPLIVHILSTDPPDHTRLRSLAQKAFTAKRVEALRPRVETLTHELLDSASRDGHFDLIADYALHIPTTIIAEMLGVPAADRMRFTKWSDALLSASATTMKGMATNLPRFLAFKAYIRELIESRRREPQDDLISALVAAEEAGDRLTRDELLSMVFILLIAGYETTVNLIGNGTLALLENPEQMERLRAHPELMPLAVEEFARYYTPVDYVQGRIARCDFELNGSRIRQGDMLFAALSSANRDERQFPQPDKLDVGREPNRHLGFGHGPHYCLGAILARMEANVAFATLVQRCPDLGLAVPRDTLRWRNSFILRGLESLPVRTRGAQQANVA